MGFARILRCTGDADVADLWQICGNEAAACGTLWAFRKHDMKRLTMSLDDSLADAFETIVKERGYENRSEAFRDLLRHDLVEKRRVERPAGPCVATLSYSYNHHERQLGMRLTDMQHEHHELTIATTHAHLDHDYCLEVVILRGATDAVQAFAQKVLAQAGVTHGYLHLIPVDSRHAHGHEHLEPLTTTDDHKPH